jgi:hypothetical protein
MPVARNDDAAATWEPDAGDGWEVVADATGSLNVIPVADWATHRLGPLCWCRPDRDDDVIVHHAADRREEYEEGRRMS